MEHDTRIWIKNDFRSTIVGTRANTCQSFFSHNAQLSSRIKKYMPTHWPRFTITRPLSPPLVPSTIYLSVIKVQHFENETTKKE